MKLRGNICSSLEFLISFVLKNTGLAKLDIHVKGCFDNHSCYERKLTRTIYLSWGFLQNTFVSLQHSENVNYIKGVFSKISAFLLFYGTFPNGRGCTSKRLCTDTYIDFVPQRLLKMYLLGF